MGCGKSCAKFLLFGFNFFFWITGIALLGFGIYLILDKNLTYLQGFVNPDDPVLKYAAYALIAVGCLILVIGFCGCCGALRESKCLLLTYAVLVLLIMIAEIAAGAYVGVRQKGFIDDAAKFALDNIKKHYTDDSIPGNTNVRTAVDEFQKEFKCCGVNNQTDWRDIPEPGANGTTFGNSRPQSCCAANETSTSCTASNAFKQGCLDFLQDSIKTYFPAVVGVACGIGALEIFGVIFAVFLACKNDD